jgi:four helix bundle protein
MEGNLQDRTKQFAKDIIMVVKDFSDNPASRVIINQLLRSATSVGANTRSAYRGRSKKEFIAKIGIVIEEADESQFWLELASETQLCNNDTIEDLKKEANELVSIFTSISKKSKE